MTSSIGRIFPPPPLFLSPPPLLPLLSPFLHLSAVFPHLYSSLLCALVLLLLSSKTTWPSHQLLASMVQLKLCWRWSEVLQSRLSSHGSSGWSTCLAWWLDVRWSVCHCWGLLVILTSSHTQSLSSATEATGASWDDVRCAVEDDQCEPVFLPDDVHLNQGCQTQTQN